MTAQRFKTSFTVFNSLTRRLEPLTTGSFEELNWYVCGPTVYDSCHIGHARTYICMDMIKRVLERFEPTIRVRQVMGITDIDDKIINRAKMIGAKFSDIAWKYEQGFVEDLRALNIRLPDQFRRVSSHVSRIVNFIENLLKIGVAYKTLDGSVYFSIVEYIRRGFAYPKFRPTLAPQKGTSNCLSFGKDEDRDFALWKAARPGEPVWDAPWGQGRPGWHIECSAFVHAAFGEKIDLHSGGIDLEFPHHENEIAQSEALNQASPWCPFFLHVGHLNFRQEKMSKSLGNTIRISDFVKGDDLSSDHLRLFCLSRPYREALEYDKDKLEAAALKLKQVRETLSACIEAGKGALDAGKPFEDSDRLLCSKLEEFKTQERQYLSNDFDTSKLLRSLLEGKQSLSSSIREYTRSRGVLSHPLVLSLALETLLSTLTMLGFRLSQEGQRLSLRSAQNSSFVCLIDEFVNFRRQLRAQALEEVHSGNTTSAQRMLELCDNLRQRLLREHSIKIEV